MSEPQLKLDYQKEINYKFLIETYRLFFAEYNNNKFTLFNPNEALRTVYGIAQQMSN